MPLAPCYSSPSHLRAFWRKAWRTKGCWQTQSTLRAQRRHRRRLLRAAHAAGKFPGMVLIHHMPGWDEWITEATRKFAHHGFATISPHLYFRDGPGSPDDVGAPRARGRRRRRTTRWSAMPTGAVGLSARAAVRQRQGRRDRLSAPAAATPTSSPAKLAAFDAIVDCWGGNVIVDEPEAAQRQAAGRADRPRPTSSTPRCSASSATTTRTPTPSRSTAPRRCSRSSARTTSSTATMAPATGSSTPRASAYPRRAGHRRLEEGVRLLPETSRQHGLSRSSHVLLYCREGRRRHRQGPKQAGCGSTQPTSTTTIPTTRPSITP